MSINAVAVVCAILLTLTLDTTGSGNTVLDDRVLKMAVRDAPKSAVREASTSYSVSAVRLDRPISAVEVMPAVVWAALHSPCGVVAR